MKIQVVGPDSVSQKRLVQNVLDTLHELQLECQLDVVHTMKDVLEFEGKQLLVTPALIVDNHILCEGHIWDKDHIKHFLQKACPN